MALLKYIQVHLDRFWFLDGITKGFPLASGPVCITNFSQDHFFSNGSWGPLRSPLQTSLAKKWSLLINLLYVNPTWVDFAVS